MLEHMVGARRAGWSVIIAVHRDPVELHKSVLSGIIFTGSLIAAISGKKRLALILHRLILAGR